MFDAIAILIAVSIVDGIVCMALGIDDQLRYNCFTERWEFVPSRFDIMLNLMIKS